MTHYFIINPVAGNASAPKFVESMMNEADNMGFEYRIIYTKYAHHATQIAKTICEKGEMCRIYACGGDGTLFDIVNGAVGYDNVEVGFIPCGSGNDYIKSFGEKEYFTDINDQIIGKSIDVDLIKYNDKYCINIASMGMDAFVVQRKNKMKRLSKISGKLSYIIAVLITFIFNMDSWFKVKIDNDKEFEKDLMFVVVSSGRFYGGGFNPTPNAQVNDGLIDVMTLNAVRRYRVLTLLSKYRKGEHINVKGLCEIKRAKKVKIQTNNIIPINLDGEIFISDRAEFEIVPAGIKFILPNKLCDGKIKENGKEFVLS